MIKILHTADWHLGKRLYNIDRLEEQKEVLDEIIEIADKEAVDIVVIAGDLFDNFNPSAETTSLLYNTLRRLSNHGARPIIAIAGNHDSPDRVMAPDVLAQLSGIFLIGYPNVVIPRFESDYSWKVSTSDEGFIEIQIDPNKPPIRIITTAYVNEYRVKSYLGSEEDKGIRDYVSSLWNKLSDIYCDNNGFNILVTHLLVWNMNDPEPQEPDGEKPIKIGNASIVYSHLVPNSIHYVALGHLHKWQNISGNTMPINYSGSPLAYSFSEANQDKFVNIISYSKGTLDRKAIPIQSGKRLLRNTFTDIDSAKDWVALNKEAHLEIKLKMSTYLSSEDIKSLQNLTNNLLNIIPEIILEKSFIEKEEYSDSSPSILDQFKAYYAYKGKGILNENMENLFNEILNKRL